MRTRGAVLPTVPRRRVSNLADVGGLLFRVVA
jgi:hypothetical protein